MPLLIALPAKNRPFFGKVKYYLERRMTPRLRFKHQFRCEIVPSEGVFLLSEKGHFLLRGRAYIQLAPLLNGQYTEEEIVDLLQDKLSIPEIYYALGLLRRKGYLTDATSPMPAEQSAFWETLNLRPDSVAERFQATPVSVINFGQVAVEPFVAALETLGLRVSDHSQYRVVLSDDYLQAGLEAFNQEALDRNLAWMLVKPIGLELWLGPLFIPGQTGCWACLAHRLRGQRKVESYLQQKNGTTGPFTSAVAALPSTLQMAMNIAATETAKWVATGHNPVVEEGVVTLDTLSLQKQTHRLVRRPQCPQCGQPDILATNQTRALVLQSQKKFFTADGGHRSLAPEETFKKLEHHLSPITGIVSAIRRTSTWENERGLTPSYVTDHNAVYMDEDLYFLRESLRGRSGGKGKSYVQAKASALGEAIERYSGIFQGDEARLSARLKELNGAAIHPNRIMHFSERQYQNRAAQKNSRYQWVPEPFDEDTEIEWSPVWSLTYNQTRYVPTAACYYGYARRYDIRFTRADSNGCAAGNNREEAIFQGFLELVERDSVALWWHNRLKRPVVDLASFDEPYFQELSAYYQTLQRDLWVLDITSDLNIPAFVAVSRRTDKAAQDIIFGFGAHLDPQAAILRTLTELNQFLPAVYYRTSDEKESSAYEPEVIEWWRTATVENQSYLVPDVSQPPKRRADYPRLWSDDLLTDVRCCVQLVAEKGLETLVLDQTRPDLDLHVVKVIVPELRHYWPRFGPGRLYQVPVQMGWLPEPLSEEALNPQLIFL
jgi:ribosomal protein S12 methylthiotransferase accessory factor